MTTNVRFLEDEIDPVSENLNYSIALGWRAQPPGYTGPSSVYEVLPTMQKGGEHGVRFVYLTPNTDVLAWLLKRLLNRPLAQIMHERIWSQLGAERDAFWIVGPTAAETAGSGLLTTLRDMARFGQLLLQQGEFNGRRILPAAVVEDIERGGDPACLCPRPGRRPRQPGLVLPCPVVAHPQRQPCLSCHGVRRADPVRRPGGPDGRGQVQLLSHAHAGRQRVLQRLRRLAGAGRLAGGCRRTGAAVTTWIQKAIVLAAQAARLPCHHA